MQAAIVEQRALCGGKMMIVVLGMIMILLFSLAFILVSDNPYLYRQHQVLITFLLAALFAFITGVITVIVYCFWMSAAMARNA